jgi:hypothetical protein
MKLRIRIIKELKKRCRNKIIRMKIMVIRKKRKKKIKFRLMLRFRILLPKYFMS